MLSEGSSGGGFHTVGGIKGGGMYSYNPAIGGFQNGMIVTAIELEDIHPGDGGRSPVTAAFLVPPA